MGPFTFSIEVQSNLGVMYANGEGVSEDNAEAVRWFRLKAGEIGLI
jgi:TPR repeat protein